MTMNENIDLTVGCCYEGSPVPFTQVMQYAQCTADDITRAVKDGVIKIIRRSIGPGGQLLRGTASLFLVPTWVE